MAALGGGRGAGRLAADPPRSASELQRVQAPIRHLVGTRVNITTVENPITKYHLVCFSVGNITKVFDLSSFIHLPSRRNLGRGARTNAMNVRSGDLGGFAMMNDVRAGKGNLCLVDPESRNNREIILRKFG